MTNKLSSSEKAIALRELGYNLLPDLEGNLSYSQVELPNGDQYSLVTLDDGSEGVELPSKVRVLISDLTSEAWNLDNQGEPMRSPIKIQTIVENHGGQASYDGSMWVPIGRMKEGTGVWLKPGESIAVIEPKSATNEPHN